MGNDDGDRRSKPPGAERRSYERFDTSIEVDYASGDTFLFSYITNISEMGIFIRSESPLEVGTAMTLRFVAQGEQLALRGEVAWVNPVKADPDENINPGMGVRFTELTQEQRERVVELVRTIAYLGEEEPLDA